MCIRGMRGQQRPGSDCADAQSDQGLRCPLPESLNTKECIDGEQRPGWDLAHVQDDPHILGMLKGFFCLMRPILLPVDAGRLANIVDRRRKSTAITLR